MAGQTVHFKELQASKVQTTSNCSSCITFQLWLKWLEPKWHWRSIYYYIHHVTVTSQACQIYPYHNPKRVAQDKSGSPSDPSHVQIQGQTAVETLCYLAVSIWYLNWIPSKVSNGNSRFFQGDCTNLFLLLSWWQSRWVKPSSYLDNVEFTTPPKTTGMRPKLCPSLHACFSF